MNKRILFIHHHPAAIDVMQDLLEELGYEILARRSPFHDLAEIEALHPDLILFELTPYPSDLGRQTLSLLTGNPESAFPPVLALFNTIADFLPEDRDLKCEHISIVRFPSDATDFVKIIQQALSTSSSSEGRPYSSSEHPM